MALSSSPCISLSHDYYLLQYTKTTALRVTNDDNDDDDDDNND